MPVSSVSDHVQTLHEIGIGRRKIAGCPGIVDSRLMPGPTNSPRFIAALAKEARRGLAGNPDEAEPQTA